MNNPIISVIVPVYNTEKYLHRCIDSLLKQTFQNFEILLINDGSSDLSGQICDEYAIKDSRVKVYHKKNGGVSSARNLGLDNCKGERICFVDSDDWVDDRFLQFFLEKDTDIIVQGFYAANWPYVDTDREVYVGIDEIEGDRENILLFLDNLWLSRNIGYLWTRCFRRAIIDINHIRFNEEFILREDEEFITKYMTYCSSYSTINKGTYHYLRPNYSNKYNLAKIDSNIKCTISIIDNLKNLSYDHPIRINNINRFGTYMFDLLRMGKYKSQVWKKYEENFKLICDVPSKNHKLSWKSKICMFVISFKCLIRN